MGCFWAHSEKKRYDADLTAFMEIWQEIAAIQVNSMSVTDCLHEAAVPLELGVPFALT